MERVNKEKRRSRVLGAFPSDDSLVQLIGSILMNINEEWITGKRYLSMDLFLLEKHQDEINRVESSDNSQIGMV